MDVDKILATRNADSTTAKSDSATTTLSAEAVDGSHRQATPVAFSSPPSTIRIVEPTAKTTAAAGGAADTGTIAAGGSSSSASGAAPGLFHASGPTSPIMPAGAATSGTLGQSLTSAASTNSRSPGAAAASSPVTEITDLPPAGGNLVRAGSAATSTAAATSVNRAAGSSTAVYGYDPQYRLLKGTLEYSQSNHQWRLRYIPADGATDNYGGSVVLGDATKLAGLHPGDFVSVQGTIGTASASQGSFAPLYNVQQVQKQ